MGGDRRLMATDHDQAAHLTRERIEKDDVVLVKGSRGMHMEKVVKMLLEGDN